MESQRILIIDDDLKLCRLLSDYLQPLGYITESVHTGPDGLEKAVQKDWDAIILDVMLPGMDGFEVLRGIRKSSDVPVLMLTTRGDEMDRIVGLEMGADDYLPKTFSTRELLARLRAVTRRTSVRQAAVKDAEIQAIVIRDLRIDPATRTAFLAEQALDLTPLEFDLLLAMMQSAGRVVSRDSLLDQVSGRDYEVFDRSIDVHVSSLRRKLGDTPRQPSYIKTVRTVGYMLMDESPK